MRIKLTAKQRRFVEEYMIDKNATQAAIRAGYSEKTAQVIGSENLSKPIIAVEIESGLAKLAESAGVTAERVIAELEKLAFTNLADYMVVGTDGLPSLDFSNLTRDQAVALTEVTCEQTANGVLKISEDGPGHIKTFKVKFKLADKRAALVDLGKHLGLFPTQHHHTGKDGGPIDLRLMVFNPVRSDDDVDPG